MRNVIIVVILLIFCSKPVYSQNNACKVDVKWDSIIYISKTSPTLQVVENPKLRPSSPIHKDLFKALKDLDADYVRYVPWFPYPKMAVAELKAPTEKHTYWDFTYLDSTMKQIFNATKGHPVVINFSTIPLWMFEGTDSIKYPEDAYKVFWDYKKGTKLRDTTGMQVADYIARIVSWYTKGGFTDELGKYHRSGYYFDIPYWEVLNEPDAEHFFTAKQYTKSYDAIVSKIRLVSPNMKFIGLSLVAPRPEYFEYFLNPKNHVPGTPIDGISYHFYAYPSYYRQAQEEYQYTFFERADNFINEVKFIELIRKRLAPTTKTFLNETGSIIDREDIPNGYWNLSGAVFAYVYSQMTLLGIDVVGESQLIGYPSQYPDVSMVNWTTGRPNARYWVLKMIKDNFNPGDKFVFSNISNINVNMAPHVQGIITRKGKKILLINKMNKEVSFEFNDSIQGKKLEYVDQTTGEGAPLIIKVSGKVITLKPFAVAILSL